MDTLLGGMFQPRQIARVSLVCFVAAVVLLSGRPSDAQVPYPGDRWSPYAVTLEDEYGTPLRSFRKDGRSYVLGYEGERYALRVENRSDARVEAVVSVDGRDAVTGQAGDYVHQRGYLVPPHGSVVVTGFRRSHEETAAFRFSDPSASYSARMGTPENVGVIGVAFFPERRHAPPRPRPRPYRTPQWWRYDDGHYRDDGERPHAERRERGAGEDRAAKRSAPSAGAAAPDAASEPYASRLGTEYGEATWSPVTEVPFERRSPRHPDSIVSLYYDDAEGLEARGIDVYPRPYWPARAEQPDPFPRSRFAPPPP